VYLGKEGKKESLKTVQLDSLNFSRMTYGDWDHQTAPEWQTHNILVNLMFTLQPPLVKWEGESCIGLLLSPIHIHPLEFVLPCEQSVEKSVTVCTENKKSGHEPSHGIEVHDGKVMTNQSLFCHPDFLLFEQKCVSLDNVQTNLNNSSFCENYRSKIGLPVDAHISKFLFIARGDDLAFSHRFRFEFPYLYYYRPIDLLLQVFKNHLKLEGILFHNEKTNKKVLLTTFHPFKDWMSYT